MLWQHSNRESPEITDTGLPQAQFAAGLFAGRNDLASNDRMHSARQHMCSYVGTLQADMMSCDVTRERDKSHLVHSESSRNSDGTA